MKQGYVLTFIIFILSALGMWMLLEGHIAAAVIIHIFSALLGIWAAVHSAQRGHSVLFDVIVAFFIPIAGGIICALASQIEASKVRGDVAADYMRHIDPEEYRTFFEENQSEFRPEPEKLQPLSDILYSRAPLSQKRIAIEALAQMECPESVKILRDALCMDSVEVRFFAASVLTRLEANLSTRMQELEAKAPDDAEGLYELAQASFDYAFFGMAEGNRKNRYLDAAYSYAKKSDEAEETAQACLLLGRIELERHNFDQAEEYFSKALTMHNSGSSAIIWQAEAALENRDFTEVIRICKHAIDKGIVPEKIKNAIEYWNLKEAP